MAMGLVVEMYNALARAVNSVTQGLPLMWQCLFFNVGGRIVSLDPQMGFGIGMGSSGCISPTGAFTGYQYNYYSGPRPMNQFCAFDQGSIYEKLCNQLGIMVRTEKDLPGGPEGGFGFYQGKTSAPAVYYDWAVASQNGDAGCTPAVDGVPWNDPSGNGYDKFSGTMTVTIGTELLSTAALLAGSPTGSKCLGTYDPVQYNAGNGPDFTNAPTGAFYVASDGSGNVATADGQRNVLGGAGLGQAYWTGGTVDLVNGFTSYRWITPDDMQRVVTSFGFPFLWREICTPLALRYFEDPTEQTTIADQSTVTASWKGTGLFILNPAYGGSSGNIRIGTDHGYTDPDWETKEIQSINDLPPFTDFKFNNSGMPGHGTLIKFCVTNDQKTAQWKVGPVGAADASTLNAPTSVNGGYGLPVEILNIASRKGLSPIFRYKNAGWSIGLIGYYLLGGGVYPTCFGCWSPGISASVDGESPMPNRPSTIGTFPQLAVQYTPKHGTAFSDLIAINYNEGSLLDQMECFAFNIYSSAPIASIPVLLSGLASWRKQRDWWSNMDNAYAAVGYYNPNNQTVPWVFVPAPPSLSLQVNNYFNGGGQNGLTIIGAADDQRYACCFSMAATGIEL